MGQPETDRFELVGARFFDKRCLPIATSDTAATTARLKGSKAAAGAITNIGLRAGRDGATARRKGTRAGQK